MGGTDFRVNRFRFGVIEKFYHRMKSFLNTIKLKKTFICEEKTIWILRMRLTKLKKEIDSYERSILYLA